MNVKKFNEMSIDQKSEVFVVLSAEENFGDSPEVFDSAIKAQDHIDLQVLSGGDESMYIIHNCIIK